MADGIQRLLIIVAGVLGAAGVSAAAGATHAGDERILGALSLIALTQAPALLALTRHLASGLMRGGALAIALGAVVFSGDMAARHFLGHGLFPMSAPMGGGLLIGGWAIVAIAGLAGRTG